MCCCNLHTTTKRRGIFFSLFFVCVFLFCFRELLVDRGGWFHLVASFIRSDEHFTPVQYREIVPNLSCCSCYSIFCSFFSAGDVWEHSNYTYEYIYIFSIALCKHRHTPSHRHHPFWCFPNAASIPPQYSSVPMSFDLSTGNYIAKRSYNFCISTYRQGGGRVINKIYAHIMMCIAVWLEKFLSFSNAGHFLYISF